MKIINVKQKNKQKTNCIISLVNVTNEIENIELNIDIVVREQLKKNMNISEEMLNKLILEQQIINAKQIAFNYVSYKKRTKKQVIDKLKQMNFKNEEINLAIENLINNKLLDDEIYAKCFIKDIMLTKKIGKNKIFDMLYIKGIDKEIITSVLNDFFIDDTLDTAIIVAERKLKSIKNKPIEKIKQSLFNHLITLIDKKSLEILNDNESMETAEVFFKNSLNISETARIMFLHRNTLIYRLDKIEKATGLNIKHFNDAVTFRLISILHKLSNE